MRPSPSDWPPYMSSRFLNPVLISSVNRGREKEKASAHDGQKREASRARAAQKKEKERDEKKKAKKKGKEREGGAQTEERGVLGSDGRLAVLGVLELHGRDLVDRVLHLHTAHPSASASSTPRTLHRPPDRPPPQRQRQSQDLVRGQQGKQDPHSTCARTFKPSTQQRHSRVARQV
eukprot:32553-Rhodomonas_salina.1